MSRTVKKVVDPLGVVFKDKGDGGAAAAAQAARDKAAQDRALAEADAERVAEEEQAKSLAAEKEASSLLAARENRTRQRAAAGGAVLTENDASFLQDNPPAKRKRATRVLLG